MLNNVQKVQAQQSQKTESKKTDKPVQHNKVNVTDVFTAALLTAKDKKLKDVNNVMQQFDKDGNGKLDGNEQLEYIKAVKKSNHKTISKDKYEGASKAGTHKNSDIEKKAFDTLANGTYNWYGKKGDHQQKERTEQVNNGSRDVQKSVRIMLDKLDVNDIIVGQEKAPETKTTAAPKQEPPIAEEVPEAKAPEEAPQKQEEPKTEEQPKAAEPPKPEVKDTPVPVQKTEAKPDATEKVSNGLTFGTDANIFKDSPIPKINLVDEFNKPKSENPISLGITGSAQELLNPGQTTFSGSVLTGLEDTKPAIEQKNTEPAEPPAKAPDNAKEKPLIENAAPQEPEKLSEEQQQTIINNAKEIVAKNRSHWYNGGETFTGHQQAVREHLEAMPEGSEGRAVATAAIIDKASAYQGTDEAAFKGAIYSIKNKGQYEAVDKHLKKIGQTYKDQGIMYYTKQEFSWGKKDDLLAIERDLQK